MDKLLTFAGYDHAGPHLFPIEPDRERTIGHIKLARPLPARVEHYIKTAKPVPGKTQLLIDALGAGEYWGENANGDYFPEEALRHDGENYGFRTFEQHAYPYKHHVNKDPSRALGDRVTLAEYDPVMHRVILIVALHNEKSEDILRDLANGKYWDVSMGCRVPWDECSICRNRARNRAEYCPDLRYRMRHILDDGRRVCAINRFPRFFDISPVIIGAEKASHVLKKVAHVVGHPYELRSSAEEGERYYGKLAAQLKSSGTKAADLTKHVPSNLPPSEKNIQPLEGVEQGTLRRLIDHTGRLKAEERAFPAGVLDQLATFPLGEIAATLAALGIPLKPEEFQKIILVKTGERQLAEKLEERRIIFDEHKIATAIPTWARPMMVFDPLLVNEKIALLVRPHLEERSCYPEPLLARIGRLEKRAEDGARDRMIYNPEWYSSGAGDDDARSSGLSAFVPAGLALAAGFLLLKRQFPQMSEKGPLALVAKHPWLLPILIAGGVGATVGLQALFSPKALNEPVGVDAMNYRLDASSKTASADAPWMRLGLIPLAYIYAGIQRRRAERGEPIGSIDNFIARRPDVAAVSSFALAPTVERGARALLKKSSATTFDAEPFDTALFHQIMRAQEREEAEGRCPRWVSF